MANNRGIAPHFRSPMKLLSISICSLFSVAAHAAQVDCNELFESARKDQTRLQELIGLNHELDTKFDEYVKADFTSQSEGLLDDLHRNAALKVAFARKRLNRAIEVQQLKVKTSGDSYCGSCKPDRKSQKKDYCSVCDTEGECLK